MPKQVWFSNNETVKHSALTESTSHSFGNSTTLGKNLSCRPLTPAPRPFLNNRVLSAIIHTPYGYSTYFIIFISITAIQKKQNIPQSIMLGTVNQ